MPNEEPIRVLLVEDDSDDAFLLTRSLATESGAFRVEQAESLADAVGRLRHAEFDVVVTDLSLPDVVGLETVTRLRPHVGQTPILVLTSLEDAGVEQAILESGAQDYLLKGEMGNRGVSRALLHAVQRQQTLNEVTSLVGELKQSHRLLERKNDDLKRLYHTAQEIVDNVSHDLRTPLTVIKDYVAMIREGIVGEINDQQRAMLEKVSVRADDLNNMVDDLLDASKLESGLLGSWRRPANLASVLDRVGPLLQERANVCKVDLAIECPSDTPTVYCDCEQVCRVVTNLTINAIKYSGAGARVRVVVAPEPDRSQVVVRVEDSGPGIDERSLHEIFQRFSQLSNAGGATTKGVGLGLNIAYKLCQLNLGELWVESVVGQGSTFSFSIPLAEPTDLLRRWFASLGVDAQPVRVVELAAAGAPDEKALGELDNFLNCSVRRGDLLQRVAPGVWLLAMTASEAECAQWTQRIQAERERANRNRPLGPIAEVQVAERLAWDVGEPIDRRLEEFGELSRGAAGQVCSPQTA